MPSRHPAWYINSLSQDYYGTDVPALLAKINRLEAGIRSRNEYILRRDVETSELRRRHDKLQSNYDKLRTDYSTVFDAYERVREVLKEERRRWRWSH